MLWMLVYGVGYVFSRLVWCWGHFSLPSLVVFFPSLRFSHANVCRYIGGLSQIHSLANFFFFCPRIAFFRGTLDPPSGTSCRSVCCWMRTGRLRTTWAWRTRSTRCPLPYSTAFCTGEHASRFTRGILLYCLYDIMFDIVRFVCRVLFYVCMRRDFWCPLVPNQQQICTIGSVSFRGDAGLFERRRGCSNGSICAGDDAFSTWLCVHPVNYKRLVTPSSRRIHTSTKTCLSHPPPPPHYPHTYISRPAPIYTGTLHLYVYMGGSIQYSIYFEVYVYILIHMFPPSPLHYYSLTRYTSKYVCQP